MSMPAKNLNANVTLEQLLPGVPAVPAIPVGGIASDSRRLRQGDVFFACQGATSHGLDFIEQAIAAGVCAVVFDASTATAVEAPIPVIAVPELAKKIGAIANRWFDSPTSSLQVAGVTGTNGKTTVAFLIAQSLQLLDQRCAYIGTLGSGIGEISNGGYMTTPTCIELHDMFAEFRDQGAGFAAIEVSSHALQQNRVDGVKFDLAIFTNLSRDHIDYHGSMRAYGEAKASLFLDYAVENRIVNVDDAFGRELRRLRRAPGGRRNADGVDHGGCGGPGPRPGPDGVGGRAGPVAHQWLGGRRERRHGRRGGPSGPGVRRGRAGRRRHERGRAAGPAIGGGAGDGGG
jgi:UDP-N-acetylmuramoyl-L-alanyl-D-glutamate--2,6-diaminopimelate ligase